jgi:hypothetical protein
MSLAIKLVGFLMCAALSILALGTGVASAAGIPTSVSISNTHEVNGYTVMELTAKVNPNGASTATVIELRKEGAPAWLEGATHNFSGTTIRSYSEEFQVSPVENYEVRVKAKNLYGPAESTTAHVSNRIMTTGEKELTNVAFGSTGVASFAMIFALVPINVTCAESSYGSIGNASGTKDIYYYSMYNCITFINGKESPKCKVKDFTFTLSGPTLAVGNPFFIPLRPETEGCALETYWQFYPKAFRVVDNGSATEYGTGRSISLTATGTLYKSNPAEVTIESEWYLSGESVGTPFKIADVGL